MVALSDSSKISARTSSLFKVSFYFYMSCLRCTFETVMHITQHYYMRLLLHLEKVFLVLLASKTCYSKAIVTGITLECVLATTTRVHRFT